VVLSGQPGHVVEIVDVDDRRPRDLASRELVRTRQHVLSALSRAPSPAIG